MNDRQATIRDITKSKPRKMNSGSANNRYFLPSDEGGRGGSTKLDLGTEVSRQRIMGLDGNNIFSSMIISRVRYKRVREIYSILKIESISKDGDRISIPAHVVSKVSDALGHGQGKVMIDAAQRIMVRVTNGYIELRREISTPAWSVTSEYMRQSQVRISPDKLATLRRAMAIFIIQDKRSG